ncbi:transmembrane protein 237B isoform X1 [Oryzias latipes]|uniref:Transmembrane protein 237b n=1 Tax=Oryzias latipes TaxID=8090 RepID=H2L2R4_ORYLA|nr:transmembrane protein 237B isoform X1 [Oryzias latipes]
MDAGGSKKMRARELPPLPQRGQRSLPAMSSVDTTEIPAAKRKKKRARKDVEGVDDTDDQGMEMGGVSSRRSSEIGEQLTLEGATEALPQRRRRKKKTPTIDLEDDQADLVNGDEADQTTDGEEVAKKPKKKKKPKVADLPDDLDIQEDDVVTDYPIPQHALFSAPQGQSQAVAKVFVERNRRFQAAERADLRKSSQQMDHTADFQHLQQPWTTRDVSVRVHGGFRVFGLYCHGFLAGYAVWNVVVVYMLAGQHLTALANLLEQYHSLAYPSQSLLYMLLAISTVAAFDRVNLAKGTVALREFITLDPVALASFLYFSALVLSLSQQMTSDRINLYPSYNATLWPPGSEHQILHPWVTVNLVVALLVGIAWICVATRPEADYTEGYLRAMEVEAPKPEENAEITA